MKQAQLNHVLNASSDSIFVVSKKEVTAPEEKKSQKEGAKKVDEQKQESLELTFQFCNDTSKDLFGTDLTEGHEDIIDMKLFTPVDLANSKQNFYKQGKNGRRTVIDHESLIASVDKVGSFSRSFENDTTLDMKAMSLRDVLNKKPTDKKEETECYLMHRFKDSNEDDTDTNTTQLTILVHRMDLNFNDKECQVINFTDVSLF